MGDYFHDPDATLDYGWNWAAVIDGKQWLAEDETIIASTWSTDSDDLTLAASTHDDTTTTIWVSGGVAGTRVQLTNHITTSDGRQDDRSHFLTVQDR